MKTKFIIGVMSVAFFAVFALATPTRALADTTPEEEGVDAYHDVEKTYVAPEQLVLTAEGILLISEEGTVENVRCVASDINGLYVLGRYICPACNVGNADNICINPRCPMYGQ